MKPIVQQAVAPDGDRGAAASIRFYFSFRSPFAWLAAERLESELGELGVPIERLPVYPTAGVFPNDLPSRGSRRGHCELLQRN